MEGIKIELPQMLGARDARYRLQQSLLTEYRKPLISFTMNIAGPIKTNSLIRWSFDYGNKVLDHLLELHKLPVLRKEVVREVTGNEAFYVVDGNPMDIKHIAMEVEQELEIGRLFDIDVLDADGSQVDRGLVGSRERSCLICDKPAKVCGRSRAHSVEELQNKTEEILQSFQDQIFEKEIASLAGRCLLYEVGTTPKPGLVDRIDNGSHKDMDIFTFFSSTSALQDYYLSCVREGNLAKQRNLTSQKTFEKIRIAGKLAEMTMKEATEGVNTHKGAIFSLGICCAALGRIGSRQYYEWKDQKDLFIETLINEIKAMTEGLSQADHLKAQNAQGKSMTVGQRLYLEHGIRGARGEAEDGFQSVFHFGLPMLESCLEKGMTINDAGVQALMEILANTTDTNMIARSDYKTATSMQKKILSLRNQEGLWDMETVEEINREFISLNLSPGGSADLLSLTYFFHFLRQ